MHKMFAINKLVMTNNKLSMQQLNDAVIHAKKGMQKRQKMILPP